MRREREEHGGHASVACTRKGGWKWLKQEADVESKNLGSMFWDLVGLESFLLRVCREEGGPHDDVLMAAIGPDSADFK